MSSAENWDQLCLRQQLYPEANRTVMKRLDIKISRARHCRLTPHTR